MTQIFIQARAHTRLIRNENLINQPGYSANKVNKQATFVYLGGGDVNSSNHCPAVKLMINESSGFTGNR